MIFHQICRVLHKEGESTVLIPALSNLEVLPGQLTPTMSISLHFLYCTFHIFSLSNFGGGIFGAAAKAASKGLDAADALADKVRMIRNALKTVFGKHINVRVMVWFDYIPI